MLIGGKINWGGGAPVSQDERTMQSQSRDKASGIDRETRPCIIHGGAILRDNLLDNVNVTHSTSPVSQKVPFGLGGYPRTCAYANNNSSCTTNEQFLWQDWKSIFVPFNASHTDRVLWERWTLLHTILMVVLLALLDTQVLPSWRGWNGTHKGPPGWRPPWRWYPCWWWLTWWLWSTWWWQTIRWWWFL